jgi:hypothetical protein
MLASALALAFTAAPVATGHPLAGFSGDPTASNSVPLTPRMIGLPGGTLHPTAGGGASDSNRVPLTPRMIGLPGGTLHPMGARGTTLAQHRSSGGVSPTPYLLGLRGGSLTRWEAQRIALRHYESSGSIDWAIGIGAAAGLAVIGAGVATRERRQKRRSSQTVQPA